MSTVVSELKVTVANTRVRTQAIKAAVSSKVPDGESLTEQEITIDSEHPLVIDSIARYICVIGYSDFNVELLDETGATVVTLPQSGLWINTGEIPYGVKITAAEDAVCSCLYS
jgi:hypothetical protein